MIRQTPLLGHNAPTIPSTPLIDKLNSEELFLKIHVSRIIGLKMLNTLPEAFTREHLGEHRLDRLPVLFFNMPKEAPIKKYSYRANESMAPSDYKAGLRAVKQSLLDLVGSKDESFSASEFGPAVNEYSTGTVFVIEQATHNGIRHHAESMQKIKAWVTKYQF